VSRAAARLAWYRYQATFRARLGGYLALAVLVGLIGGVTMASLTAARRTDSSYPDYLAGTSPSGLIVQPNSNLGGAETVAQADRLCLRLLGQMRRLPHVSGLVTADAYNTAPLTRSGGFGPVIAAAGLGALAQANIVAALPGHRAARTPAAEVLRAE
jgi:hypothetical protein